MKMVLDKSESKKTSVFVSFGPMKGSFKSPVDMSIVQIAMPVRRREAVIKVDQHQQESKSILVVTNDR